MVDISDFDLDAVEELDIDGDLIPSGDYIAMVTRSEKKTSQAGNEYIQLEFTIEGSGRRIWHNLNLYSSNDIARRISGGHLKQICKATGILRPRSTDDFLEKPIKIRVGVQKNDPSRNDIKKFMPVEGEGGGAQQAASDVSPEEKPKARKAPWAR